VERNVICSLGKCIVRVCVCLWTSLCASMWS